MTQKQPYIADGFMKDCEELVRNLTKKYDIVDWHKFCYVWKEMEFDLLFYGRQSGAEVVEFTEEVLQVARLFLVTKTNTFESQVIGLFIAYTITLIQPYKDLCSLRLIPVDAPVLEKFEAELRREKRYDVLMILARMYFQGRTEFHVALRERAMDTSIRKYFDGTVNVPYAIEKRWHGELNRDRIKALEDIAQEEMKYVKLKKQAMLATKALNPGAKFQPDVFRPAAKQIAESLRKLTTIVEEPMRAEDNDTAASQIKKKAMKNTVDPMKHLHGLDDRKKEKEKKTVSEPALESPKHRKRSKRAKPIEHKPEPEFKPPVKTYSKRSSKGEAVNAFSLPSLDDSCLEGSSLKSLLNDRPAEKEDLNLGGSKAQFQGFKGFTIEEIQSSDFNKICALKGVNKPKENDGSKIKATSDKTSPNAKKNPKKKVQEPIPGCSRTIKKTPSDQIKKKKKKWTYKNKLNKKLRLASNFDNSDSDTSTDMVYTSDEDKTHTKMIEEAEMCKGKELTIQSKGVVKHFVEYEVDENIVIRTEKDAPPAKDIEIEYIDNFTEANAYEEVCELSDDETKKDNTGKAVDIAGVSQNKATEECDGDDDLVEVFQIITEDAELDINQPSTSSEGFSSAYMRQEADSALEKILGNKNRVMDRRLLARPNLRSKFKKLGLLDFANLEYAKNDELNSDSD